jgi:hypothetical protein
MLINWLLTISLSMGITLGAIQSFLVLSKYYSALVAISHEQSQIRFLVGYFHSVLRDAVRKDQLCGKMINQNTAVISVAGQKDHVLHVCVCQKEGERSVLVPMRFFLVETEKQNGKTLFVQEGDNRREALSTGLRSFSLSFCESTKNDVECRPASEIQDWSRVAAIEFTLQFQSNFFIDNYSRLKNDHRLQYTIKIGDHK